MEPTEARTAAKERYRTLRTDIYVPLSERCTVDHVSAAATAVADMIRPELETVYAALLEARSERDEALKRVAKVERTPRCGATTPHAFEDWAPLGPCILAHGHPGMHEEGAPAGFPLSPGSRWTEHDRAGQEPPTHPAAFRFDDDETDHDPTGEWIDEDGNTWTLDGWMYPATGERPIPLMRLTRSEDADVSGPLAYLPDLINEVGAARKVEA